MKRLSVIIPMYNVAPCVERCIRSLEDQDIPKEDYELICINDGSPDNCREIIEQLQKEFLNIVLINQENQGVSMARNNGIDRAKGKYLLMIDPDDYVDNNSFARVLNTADEQNAQVDFLGFTFLNEDDTVRKTIFNEGEKGEIYPGIEAYFTARVDGRTDPDRMWAVLYEKEFINKYNLRYLPNVPYLEDGELIARIMCLAQRCIFDGHSFYQRITRPGSATNSELFHSEKATNGFILAAQNLKKFQSSNELTTAQKDFLNQPICKFILLAINSSLKVQFIAINHTLKHLKQLGLQKCNVNGCKKVYKRFAYLYNISQYMGVLYLKLRPVEIKAFKFLKIVSNERGK